MSRLRIFDEKEPQSPLATHHEHAAIAEALAKVGVRFFVAGSGQFTLHIDGKVYDILCEQGDLIGVPDGTRHWFDMSETPYFVAIRLFTNKEGWVAQFTGDDIAGQFPRMQPHRIERP